MVHTFLGGATSRLPEVQYSPYPARTAHHLTQGAPAPHPHHGVQVPLHPASKGALMRLPGRLGVLVLSTVFAAASISPPAAAATSVRPDDTYVTNGPVHAVARSGDTIYIGGQFDRVGPRTGPGVEVGLDGARHDGLPEIAGAGMTSMLGSGGAVNAVAADGSGGWYVAGLFSHVGGVGRTNVAHIRADHTVDPSFDAVVNDKIQALVVSGSRIYIAGKFTQVDGQPRNNIAALNADGSLSAFNPDANAPVEALAMSPDGSTLYAGGRFSVIGGLPRLALAALSAADGSARPTFSAAVTGTTGVGVVSALALSGSTLYVGGSFNSLGGLPRTNIGAVSVGLPLDGIGVQEFDPSPSRSGCAACGSVSALAVAGSTVYAGGMFDTIGGQRRNYLAGLRASDGTATAFDPSPNGNIFGVTVAGSTVYASGGFRSIGGAPSIGGQARNYVAALDAGSGVATGFDPNPNNLVTTIGVSADAVYLGGAFSSLGGEVRNGIAALSAVDGTVTDFDPNAQGFNGGRARCTSVGTSARSAARSATASPRCAPMTAQRPTGTPPAATTRDPPSSRRSPWDRRRSTQVVSSPPSGARRATTSPSSAWRTPPRPDGIRTRTAWSSPLSRRVTSCTSAGTSPPSERSRATRSRRWTLRPALRPAGTRMRPQPPT
jgi:hypothetical protein